MKIENSVVWSMGILELGTFLRASKPVWVWELAEVWNFVSHEHKKRLHRAKSFNIVVNHVFSFITIIIDSIKRNKSRKRKWGGGVRVPTLPQ